METTGDCRKLSFRLSDPQGIVEYLKVIKIRDFSLFGIGKIREVKSHSLCCESPKVEVAEEVQKKSFFNIFRRIRG
jgi:hypothetical protein